ncbi:MAG: hypothetical protein KJ769_08365, partial [Candidatus Margulisbacteria bacterium]|nr:hypothetical protein [Candidatus Margulisiibacteriota bacterium]
MNITFPLLDKGLILNIPKDNLDLGATPLCQNIYIINGEVTTRSGIKIKYTKNWEGVPLVIQDYLALDGNKYILLFTTTDIYNISNNWENITPKKDGIKVSLTMTEKDIYYFVTINNKLIITNGVDPILTYNGSGCCIYLNCPYKAKIIKEYKTHLFLLNTIEDGYPITQRVRWSATGNPENWENYNSNFVDLVLDEKKILGCTIQNINMFIYKSSSIIICRWQGEPSLFAFEENAVVDIGLTNTQTLCSFSNVDYFLGELGVFGLSGNSLDCISLNVNKEILVSTKEQKEIKAFIDYELGNYNIIIKSGIYWSYNIENKVWTYHNLCGTILVKKRIIDLSGKIKDLKGSIKSLSAPYYIPNLLDIRGYGYNLESNFTLIEDLIGDIEVQSWYIDEIEENKINKNNIYMTNMGILIQSNNQQDCYIDKDGKEQNADIDAYYTTPIIQMDMDT